MKIRNVDIKLRTMHNGDSIMSITFDRITEGETFTCNIPDILLDGLAELEQTPRGLHSIYSEDSYFLKLRVIPDSNNRLYTCKLKVKEMTVKEIQKELGYSIKIID